MITPPILKDQNNLYSYLTVPPVGYGGVENVMYALISGLLYYKHEVIIIGAPGSRSMNGVTIVRHARTPIEIREWISKNSQNFDIIHDHGCGLVFNHEYAKEIDNLAYVATHHQTGRSPYPKNTIYLSNAQRTQALDPQGTIVRIPVIVDDYIFNAKKEDYYLYLGRISEWKGVYEAAALCAVLKKKLILAGPAWESYYFNKIKADFNDTIKYVGNISGLDRLELLARAQGVFVLSRFIEGRWGDSWCEPGSTVVSEACASGTAVISSTNGCLSELVVPDVGIQFTEEEISNQDISRLIKLSFNPAEIRAYAEKNWGHLYVSQQYIDFYSLIISGKK